VSMSPGMGTGSIAVQLLVTKTGLSTGAGAVFDNILLAETKFGPGLP
jgi:hypothetical protein